jgi:GDPmannose 4,6-dehydratase
MKKAIITGITGQDAACLAKLLLSKGYKVYGTYRKNTSVGFWRIKELEVENHANLELIEYDLEDLDATIEMLKALKPDELYNLAAQSHIAQSFEEPIDTASATGMGVLNILEAIRRTDIKIKLFQASSSEIFGKITISPQVEETKFYPRNPYGVSKVFAHMMSINYRQTYNIFACIGILYNHESALRSDIFVTRKITNSVAKIKLKKLDVLKLGNLDAKRDWGYADEYVEAMHMMMQETKPDTYILATGKAHSVRDFVIMAFKAVGIELEFSGSGENEFAIDTKTKKVVLEVNPIFYRPLETELLIGNPKKIKDKLGWESKTSLEEICKIMVEADLKRNLNNEL